MSRTKRRMVKQVHSEYLMAYCKDRDLPIGEMEIVPKDGTWHHAWDNNEG